jgi:hypothetical protein
MEINLKANHLRNEKMIKLVDVSTSNSHKRNSQSITLRDSSRSKLSLKAKDKSIFNSYIEFDEVEDMVFTAKKRLD